MRSAAYLLLALSVSSASEATYPPIKAFVGTKYMKSSSNAFCKYFVSQFNFQTNYTADILPRSSAPYDGIFKDNLIGISAYSTDPSDCSFDTDYYRLTMKNTEFEFSSNNLTL
jgi:hypothetical protein